MMSATLLLVDAFTTATMRGNPAAVCLLPPPGADDWKQRLAAELNLAETAFVERMPQEAARTADSSAGQNAAAPWLDPHDRNIRRFDTRRAALPEPHCFRLRWFTPLAEVPLCGHATLASAHALWEEGLVPRDAEITFSTLSGRLRATCSEAGITLDFPAIVATEKSVPMGLESALGCRILHFAESETKLLVELESEEDVRRLQPNMTLLRKLPKEGVIVTARARSPRGIRAGEQDTCDFVSRFFAPKLGIPEDAVTGSSHCVLGPWWQAKLGKNTFYAKQLSERGGAMHVRVETFVQDTRVFLTGQAVTAGRRVLQEFA